MLIIPGSRRLGRPATQRLRNIHILAAILSSLLCLGRAPAAEGRHDERPVLQVPVSDSKPVIDGRLDEPCWKAAATTGPLQLNQGQPAKSTTNVLLLRDAEHLYVGITCELSGPAAKEKERAKQPDISKQEHVALLIDSNHDRRSYYLIILTQDGTVETSYKEHWPPWMDRTWQPRFKSAVASNASGWTAEFSLPFTIFHKNRTLASEFGLNVRRYDMRHGEIHCWSGEFSNPADAGVLRGMPTRERLPTPEYADHGYKWAGPRPTKAQISFLAEQEGQRIRLGPGSTHPGTTGEVRLELEGFLLDGNVHARAIIWDLAVNEMTGELYVLSDPRPVRGVPDVRVFDRQGNYLRTIMPFNANLPRASVQDLCRKTALEGGVGLVVPKLFEVSGGELTMYGAWWNLPQKIAVAPNGDLILSSMYKGTLMRIRPDGSLSPEGWTSIYHRGRNEPFESADWVVDRWHAHSLKHYLPHASLRYPYIALQRNGNLYVSDGLESRQTQLFGRWWEVKGHGDSSTLHKLRLIDGIRFEGVKDFRFSGDHELPQAKETLGVAGKPGQDNAHLDSPCGLAIDDDYLIVADSGNNRLQIFERDGRLAGSITNFEQDGRDVPLGNPIALAIDLQRHLYVLALIESERRLLKLDSWREPRLLAVSEPLDAETFQIAVDAGVDPPLVWIANGAGLGTLLQLAGDNLAEKGKWAGDDEKLSNPAQYGGLPILNIDPQVGHIYVEDDSHYRSNMYGTVYQLSQSGTMLKKWEPVFFHTTGKREPDTFGITDRDGHFRNPDEPLSIDSIFGKDGKIYRWKLRDTDIAILRFDRSGRPIPFEATGSNALVVETELWGARNRHDIYHGMDIDRHGNIYYVAKVSRQDKVRHRVDVYDSDGNLKKKGLLHLSATRWIQVDEQGNLYALYKPSNPPWCFYLTLSKFPPSGGEPLWSRRWDGIIGQVDVYADHCMCLTSRLHQALDGKGYLYAAGKYSVQAIDCETGKLVGEFGSYGNMDCQGRGGEFPHPELPFGTISALSVWKDRLFVVDVLNRRIAKCRIIYDPAKRKTRLDPEDQ